MTRSGNRSAIHRLLSVTAMLSTLCWAASAQATRLVGDTTDEAALACGHGATDFDARPAAQAMQLAAQTSKSAAILGGQASALDQIRMAQQADTVSDLPAADLAAAGPMLPEALAPAIGGVRPQSNGCSTREQPLAGAQDNDYLASKRTGIGRTAFDRDWRRVSGDRISARRYRKLIGSVSSDGFAALRSVNGWVNQAITFTEDRDLFSRADYWAGAGTTLKLRRGDCEDIALTKMQLLAAAGIPREDMILTIARDLVRNADHAVLIVRYNDQYYMLDNATDEVLDASPSHDYRPILSFGSRQTWLHGY